MFFYSATTNTVYDLAKNARLFREQAFLTARNETSTPELTTESFIVPY